jgi:hypothetical protein
MTKQTTEAITIEDLKALGFHLAPSPKKAKKTKRSGPSDYQLSRGLERLAKLWNSASRLDKSSRKLKTTVMAKESWYEATLKSIKAYEEVCGADRFRSLVLENWTSGNWEEVMALSERALGRVFNRVSKEEIVDKALGRCRFATTTAKIGEMAQAAGLK